LHQKVGVLFNSSQAYLINDAHSLTAFHTVVIAKAEVHGRANSVCAPDIACTDAPAMSKILTDKKKRFPPSSSTNYFPATVPQSDESV